MRLRPILLGYLRWEMELNESMFVVGKGGKPKRVRTGVKAHEEALGEIEFERNGVVLQVPLYAYALAKKLPGTQSLRVEYRALKKPDAVHSLELFTFDPKTGAVVGNTKADAKMEAALDAVVTHVRGAREGNFPVRPAPSCKCPSFCHALEICRVPGGPDTGGW